MAEFSPTGPLPPQPRTQVSRLSHSSTRSTDSTLNIFLEVAAAPPPTNQKPRRPAVQLGVGSEASGSRPASGGPSLPSGRSRGADAGRSSALSPAPPSFPSLPSLPPGLGAARPPRARAPAHALLRGRSPARAEAQAPLRTRALGPPRPAPGGALPTPVRRAWARAPARPRCCGGGGGCCVSPDVCLALPGAPHCACADAGAAA